MVSIVHEPTVSDEPFLQGGAPFFRDDLESTPNDGRRYEIIDGTLIVSAAPSRLHQRALFELAVLLRAACPAELEVMIAPFSVGLSINTDIQPDIIVASRRRLTDKDLPGVPELVVEVLSPSTRQIDLHVKRERFDQAGCPSFWIVDPSARPEEARLIAWQLAATKRYEQIANVTGEQEFHATLPYPVTVVPAALVR
jgi:Uma2 family endonuclease